MRARTVWKPVGPVRKNAEIERLYLELASFNERIQELRKAASRSVEDRGTEGKGARAGAAD